VQCCVQFYTGNGGEADLCLRTMNFLYPDSGTLGKAQHHRSWEKLEDANERNVGGIQLTKRVGEKTQRAPLSPTVAQQQWLSCLH
jgi:hypothetical protein